MNRADMKVEAKSFDSLEIEDPLDRYWPNDVTSFGTWVRVGIGSTESDAADEFRIFICTPTWLASHLVHEKDGVMWGRHMLVVSEYNLERIKGSVERLISRCSGNEWPIIAQKLSQYAQWEFEDYQE